MLKHVATNQNLAVENGYTLSTIFGKVSVYIIIKIILYIIIIIVIIIIIINIWMGTGKF